MAVFRLMEVLRGRGRWLVIYKNVSDPAVLAEYPSGGGMLVTSRSRSGGTAAVRGTRRVIPPIAALIKSCPSLPLATIRPIHSEPA